MTEQERPFRQFRSENWALSGGKEFEYCLLAIEHVWFRLRPCIVPQLTGFRPEASTSIVAIYRKMAAAVNSHRQNLVTARSVHSKLAISRRTVSIDSADITVNSRRGKVHRTLYASG